MNPQTFNLKLSQLSKYYQQCSTYKTHLSNYEMNDILINLSSNTKISQLKRNSKLNKQHQKQYQKQQQLNKPIQSKQSQSKKSQISYQVKNQENNQQENEEGKGLIEKQILLDWLNVTFQNLSKSNSSNTGKLQGNKTKYTLINEISKLSIQHVNEILPYNKISFTSLLSKCLSNNNINSTSSSSQSSIIQSTPMQPFQTYSPTELIKQILVNSILIKLLKKQVLPYLSIYIPIMQQKLTLQQLREYLLCQNIKASEQYIILALNGNLQSNTINNTYLHYQFCKSNTNNPNKQQQQSEQDITQISNILNRLNNRVENFGKEWLISSNQQKQ